MIYVGLFVIFILFNIFLWCLYSRLIKYKIIPSYMYSTGRTGNNTIEICLVIFGGTGFISHMVACCLNSIIPLLVFYFGIPFLIVCFIIFWYSLDYAVKTLKERISPKK